MYGNNNDENKVKKKHTQGAKGNIKINLVNVQGLTRSKLLELEDILRNDCDILCLTETQQKFEKYDVCDGVSMVESMREVKDKKGGGLRIMFRSGQNVKATKQPTASPDILYAIMVVGTVKLHLILVYLPVIKSVEDRERSRKIKAEVDNILEKVIMEDEASLLLGDMNGHIRQIGYQKEDENGRIVLDWINNSSMILLNLEEFCTGTYTWSRQEQKSTIDYVLANRFCYQWVECMKIDEEKELFDLSDHHMIMLNMILPARNVNFNKGTSTAREYWKVDDDSLCLFGEEMHKRLQDCAITNIQMLNDLMAEVANDKLKATYRRKNVGEQQVKEKPWITDEIRTAIKKRKEINRERRKETDKKKEQVLIDCYQAQKKKVQELVKEAVTKSEKKTTEDIRNGANKSKSIFENIDKLRKKERSKQDIYLYDSEGKKLDPEEEQEELVHFWKTIYQQHPNNIKDVWNDKSKNEYEEGVKQEDQEVPSFPRHMRELMDMALPTRQGPAGMTPAQIDSTDVMDAVKAMRNKSAPGPDKLKPELYKALVSTRLGLDTLTRCLQQELDDNTKPESWKTSKTKMIPKTKKPTAKDLRPIALTNVSYKLFMSILKTKIEEHLKENDEMLEIQAGFTNGGKIEDNLFLLRYCVEDSFHRKKPLYVTAIDYKKAFDSVNRAEMIETLKLYKIDAKIIEATSQIYQGDTTTIRLNDRTEAVIEVTSGIRQGCNGSTTSFKLVTYVIAKTLMMTGLGFKNDSFHIPVLLFADDGLILTQTLQETEQLLGTLTSISRKFGLHVNREKSAILIFNSQEQPKEIANIPVVNQIKYLGVTVINKKKLFKEHINRMIQKAQKMANMTFGITQKCCNKLMIGKCYWKCLALPSFLHGVGVVSLTESDIKQLQTCENGVFRQILGAPRYSPICTLRGEVGASLMKTRIMEGHLKFLRSSMQGNNDLIRKVAREELGSKKSSWAKTIQGYLKSVGLSTAELEVMNKSTLKRHMQDWDNRQWKEELEARTSIEVYRMAKTAIREDPIYDNTPASVVLFRARSNTLPLGTRKRYVGEDTTCALCGDGEETQYHFILECIQLSEERLGIPRLQKPHPEDTTQVLKDFLFNENQEEMEHNKTGLYKLWQCRRRKLATVAGNERGTEADGN